MRCETCQKSIPTLVTRVFRVNGLLWELGKEYHDTLSYSLNAIDRILAQQGFNEMDVAPITTGINGRLHCEVGENKWLSVSWHRMDESGRYEVTAYVN